ncbi:molybdate ABC transporter substrate-binding protein [Rhodoferax sp.]|uniref:molybdate ABC transporter substrate-binding protein n=1 Tax=Rhodoferax sp. TaxID=50421 RepID=UPI002755049E|nr:molybdate ABC transporter substrate-binding protein [Rhodoferax sp.]
MRFFQFNLICGLGLVGLLLGPAHAQPIHVAVAANFAVPMKRLAADFEKTGPYKVQLSAGSTGKLSAQIRSGAPFDVLVAADAASVQRLLQERHAVSGSAFTYATGRLMLWSAQAGLVDAQGEVLKRQNFRHLAVAAPQLAPYGAAAMQTLGRLGLSETLAPKLVQGESIAQTYSFVATGNAELGFVARSQVWENGSLSKGSAWLVPATMHDPLHQQAALLTRAGANPGATALLQFLKTGQAKAVIRSFGYETD